MPNATTLSDLAEEIREINTANGWNVLQADEWEDQYKIPAILALIHSEVSEALEAFRAGNRHLFCEELSDVLIRVLDSMPAVTSDIDGAIRKKLEFNKTREYRYGGKRI